MIRKHALLIGLLLVGCGMEAPSPGTTVAEAPAQTTAVKAGKEAPPSQAAQPSEKFDHGARAFEAAKNLLLQKYYKEGFTEDDLYRAATRGMLEDFDPDMRPWHKLLSPSELAELHGDLKGEVVGIGVEIKFDPDSGYTEVLGVLPKSAAERAGLVRGDTIVSIDGKLFKGATQREVISHIRGKAGEAVHLSVLHEDKLQNVDVVREVVALDAVTHLVLMPKVGYVRIRSFSEKTAALTRSAVQDLESKGVQALVLDLRQNPGGSFDAAIATAGTFLSKGTPVVKTKKRGEKEEVATSPGDPVLANAPLAVLVDGGTSSGAELIAGALVEGRHAELVGTHTLGKWSVQMIDDLENGYAVKYTVSLFSTPSGHSYEGHGLEPDVRVDMDEKSFGRVATITDPAEKLQADVQLRTAVGLLRVK